jgi:hypothetical protein
MSVTIALSEGIMGTTADIIDFESRYAADFKRLTLEWLELHFHVEPIDEQVT